MQVELYNEEKNERGKCIEESHSIKMEGLRKIDMN